MEHILPPLEGLINKEFYLILTKSDIDLINFTESKMVFYQSSDQFYSLQSHHFQSMVNLQIPIESMPWNLAKVVNLDTDWYHLYEQTDTSCQLLIKKDDQYIGYVNSSTLAYTAIKTYTYLKTYFDTILATTESSITVINQKKNTVVWTSGAERIFSIEKETILGKPINDFFKESFLEITKTLETGDSICRRQHQPREDVFVLINTNPVKLGNKIIGAVAAETDITHQVLLSQELKGANQTIEDLREKVLRFRACDNPFLSIKGSSFAIRKTIEKIKQIGTTQAKVLFLGESGVGKELFAKAMHDIRCQEDSPFVPVNCGAIPETLFESELFGYEKGAFSGASTSGKKGKFELAKGGTLFLDEIGELPLDMQVKLLRVLQEGKYFQVGGTIQKTADCQIIAATNKDLQSLVHEGKFREDLYYRLNIISIKIPALRERIEDIVELSHLFLFEFSTKYIREVVEIPKEIMTALLNYDWPGNVRELRNTIERLVVFSVDGKLDMNELPFKADFSSCNHASLISTPISNSTAFSLKDSIERHERELIEQALSAAKNNKNKAAEQLNISRATLYNKMNKLGMVD